MLDLLQLAATEHGEETSKAAFYIAGSILAGWAVVLTAIGMSRPAFPGSVAVSRGVIAITAVLVIAVCTVSILTG